MATHINEYTDDHFVNCNISNKLDSKQISLLRKDIHRKKRSRLRIAPFERFQWIPQPVSILNEGNSDPFNALAVNITPQINKAISFLRDTVVPSVYFTPFGERCDGRIADNLPPRGESSFPSNEFASWNREIIRLGLYDEATATSSTMMSLALMNLCEPETTTKDWTIVMQMQTRAYKLTRQNLESNIADETGRKQLVIQLYYLFRTDCILGNIAAAVQHGSALQYLLRDANVEASQVLISILLECDTVIAMKNMQRTIFDVEIWIPSLFKTKWPSWEKLIPEIPAEYIGTIDPVIDKEPLLGLFRRSRRLLTIAESPRFKVKTHAAYTALVSYIWTRGIVDIGILINHYIDLADTLEKSNNRRPRGEISSEACICLAALCIIRWIAHTATINGVDLRNTADTLVSHLQNHLDLALRLSTPQELQRYWKAHLWICFVGALYHQKTAKAYQKPVSSWFHSRLVLLAKLNHVLSWTCLQPILQSFIYSDYVEPNGALWFDQVLDAGGM